MTEGTWGDYLFMAEIEAPEREQLFWRKTREVLADYVAGKQGVWKKRK